MVFAKKKYTKKCRTKLHILNMTRCHHIYIFRSVVGIRDGPNGNAWNFIFLWWLSWLLTLLTHYRWNFLSILIRHFCPVNLCLLSLRNASIVFWFSFSVLTVCLWYTYRSRFIVNSSVCLFVLLFFCGPFDLIVAFPFVLNDFIITFICYSYRC